MMLISQIYNPSSFDLSFYLKKLLIFTMFTASPDYRQMGGVIID